MKFGYLRISLGNYNVDTQLNELLKHGVLEKNIYSDYSNGVKDDRSGFKELLNRLNKGDTLYVHKINRIAKNAYHLAKLINHFETNGILFQSVEEPIINTTHPNFPSSFFGLIQELEKDLQSERTITGLENAKRIGRVGGRRKGLSEEAMNKARAAESLYRENKYPVEYICELTNIKSKRTLYSYLRYRNVEIGKMK
jgi:DNA invertase Pin-like site-specific DNA recombinase